VKPPEKTLAGPLRLRIVNERGLHARASARFVTLASGFDAAITVSKDGNSVPGTSIMGLMMLCAGRGDAIDVLAEGPDAETALAALARLVESGFGEER
jgi:phosphocarrier protein HPr